MGNKNSGDSDGQWNDPVYGSNDDWWKCAQKCNDNGGCAGWTFVYDGSGTNQRQCWLKPTLVSTDCNSWGSKWRQATRRVTTCKALTRTAPTLWTCRARTPRVASGRRPTATTAKIPMMMRAGAVTTTRS